MLTNPKSALQKKLQAAQMAAANIRLLTEVRTDFAGNALHGGAIDAGIAALADQIDSQIDDVYRLIEKDTEVAHV